MTDESLGRVADSGLQNERTALAWFRTGLSFAGAGALLLHASAAKTQPVPGLLGAAALAAGGVGVLVAGSRYRCAEAAVRGGRPAVAPSVLIATTAVITLMIPLGLLFALLGRAL